MTMTPKFDDILDLEKKILECARCPRLKAVAPYPMAHICYSPTCEVPLFIIGRNPGLEDTYAKVTSADFKITYHRNWLKCKFGMYVLERLGMKNVKKIFFTNVCKCSTPENSQLKNEEKASCAEYLQAQIRIISPKLILAFGRDAIVALVGKKPVKFFETFEADGYQCLSLYHPGYFNYADDPKIKEKQDKILQNLGEKL